MLAFAGLGVGLGRPSLLLAGRGAATSSLVGGGWRSHRSRWVVVGSVVGVLVVAVLRRLRQWKRRIGLATLTTGRVGRVWVAGVGNGVIVDGGEDGGGEDGGGDLWAASEVLLAAEHGRTGDGDGGPRTEYIVARERVVSRPVDVRNIRCVFWCRPEADLGHGLDNNDDGDRASITDSGTTSKDDGTYKDIHRTSTDEPLLPPLDTVLDLDALVTAYIRATMTLFATYTPQAYAMRLHPAVRQHLRSAEAVTTTSDAQQQQPPEEVPAGDTFSREYISQCGFQPGERVCGVYVVEKRLSGTPSDTGSQRRVVVLGLSPPGGRHMWKEAPRGVLVVGVEEVCDHEGDKGGGGGGREGGGRWRRIRFVNETVLWRTAGEKPVFLESRIGKWVHSLMAAWFVVAGTEAVSRPAAGLDECGRGYII